MWALVLGGLVISFRAISLSSGFSIQLTNNLGYAIIPNYSR